MSSDDSLVLRAAEGDRRAFEEIYSRYHQDLYRFCLAMLGNPQDAQDALQNTMVKVLRALPGEKREIRLKPWLYRIARNESVETLRKRRDNLELEREQGTVGAAGVAGVAETRDRLRVLLADLERLPERQRAAVVMRELSGLDFDQIGAAFGTSAAVARQTLYEARLSLRQMEAGREMQCAEVTRALSDADGRVARRREIRAHLRSCAGCRAFRAEIAERHQNLAALAPLPLAASAGLLHSVLGASAGGAAGNIGSSLAGTVGAGTGKAVATSAIVKSAATAAVVATIGVSVADRSGLIDPPLPGKGGDSPAQSAAEPPRSPAGSDLPEGTDAAPRNEVVQERPQGGIAETESQGKKRAREKGGDGDSQAGDDAARVVGASIPQAGARPPGGGYGRSASGRRGPSDQLPEAADHGQQTAAAHKPANAASPPGGGDGGGSSGGDGPPAAPPSSHKAQAPAAPHASQPSAQATDGPTESEGDTLPHGHER